MSQSASPMKSNNLTCRVEERYPRGTECRTALLQVHLRLYLGEDAKCIDTIRALKFNNIYLLGSKIIFKKCFTAFSASNTSS